LQQAKGRDVGMGAEWCVKMSSNGKVEDLIACRPMGWYFEDDAFSVFQKVDRFTLQRI